MLGYIIWGFSNKDDMKTSLKKKHFRSRDCLRLAHLVCILQCWRITLTLNWCARRWIIIQIYLLFLSWRQSPKCGNFQTLFRTEWHGISRKCVPHVQRVYFSWLNKSNCVVIVMTSTTTPQINDLIGWTKKNDRATRLLVQFFDVKFSYMRFGRMRELAAVNISFFAFTWKPYLPS